MKCKICRVSWSEPFPAGHSSIRCQTERPAVTSAPQEQRTIIEQTQPLSALPEMSSFYNQEDEMDLKKEK